MADKDNYYRGYRLQEAGACSVFVNDTPLPPRYDLRNHSPDGFQWGYGGSGPAQLALAILAYEFGDSVAKHYYQDFKWRVIARIGSDIWTTHSIELLNELKDIIAERTQQEVG